MRTWHYTIDREGRLWHEGAEINDPQVLKLFMRNMQTLPDGRFQAMCQGEKCFVTAEDVPYVIQSIHSSEEKIDLEFPGGYHETLDPQTLFVGKENVLYCKIRDGLFTARFSRKPYLELAKNVRFDKQAKSYFLSLGSREYLIKGV